ncbi:MAG TPA: CopG family antitoxin [Desulfobacterales bacterium]|nr:CopG family antitoxin [Desulfobacterales bacterium]
MKNNLFLSDMLKQYSIRLPEGDIKKIREIANKKGIPYQVMIRMILRGYLNDLEAHG